MSDFDYLQKDYYFRVDEKSDTLDNLQKTRVFLEQVGNDYNYWKWAMIAFHNALYESMILALKGTNFQRVAENPKAKNFEKMRVINLREALSRVQKKDYMRMYVNSKRMCIHPDAENLQGEYPDVKFFGAEVSSSIEHLNKVIRNQFMHYLPISISFGIGGFVEIIEDIIPVINFLLLESGNVLLEENEIEFIKNEIKKIKNINRNIKDRFLITPEHTTA